MEVKNFLFPSLSASDECLPIQSKETLSYIFCNKVLVRLHYLLYDIFNSSNSIRPLLSRRSMENEYIHLTNITESSFSWQLLMSPASSLRQVVYPSFKVKNTLVPSAT